MGLSAEDRRQVLILSKAKVRRPKATSDKRPGRDQIRRGGGQIQDNDDKTNHGRGSSRNNVEFRGPRTSLAAVSRSRRSSAQP